MTPTVTRATETESTTIDLGRLRGLFSRGLVLTGEVVVVPGVLLYLLVAAGHPMLGIAAVLGWRALFVVGRMAGGVRVPMTCWLAFGLFLARTVVGLAVSSVSVYLLVPILLCAGQGVVFLGSGLIGRPVLFHLAADYVADIPDRPALRRLFAQMSGIWGGIHLACAALGIWALTLSSGASVAVTSILGVGCTLASAGGCIGWGLWRSSRIPGLRIVCGGPKPVPAEPEHTQPQHAQHLHAEPLRCLLAAQFLENAA